MYEHLRNSFVLELQKFYGFDEIEKILQVLDIVMYDYDIVEKQTALAVVDNEIPKLVKIYLASKKLEGVADSTLGNYACRLRQFFNVVGNLPEKIETNEIRLFLVQYQKRTGISDRTLEKFRQIINGFFEWCVNEEYLLKNPCKNIKAIKFEYIPRQSLTRFQLEQVRRSCKLKRDLAMVDVLYSTGCRIAELVNMKFSDIENDSIKIIGKGKKHNTVYLNTNAQLSLKDYLQERKGSSEYLFVSRRMPYNRLTTRHIERIFRDLGKDLNIKLTPHVLRHTSATLALQNGMPITQVQKMLGHSSVATTQIYAKTSQEDVAQAHKKFVI